MTDHEAAVLIDRVSSEVADGFRPRLREVERENDRLLGEMRVLRQRLLAERGSAAGLRKEIDDRDRRLMDLAAMHAEVSGQAQRWAEQAISLEAALKVAGLADKVYALLVENYPPRVLGWVRKAAWEHRESVRLDDIKMARRPGGRDPAKVEGIADAIQAGQEMDPVVLVQTSDGLEIADGYHRTLAFQKAGRKTIPACVGSGVGDHGPWERAMHDAKLNLEDIERLVALERVYTDQKRPPAHDHSTDAGAPPVIVFDLHGTLTPSLGLTAFGEPGAMLPPFPGVKDCLDRWAGQGICLHVATGALSPEHGPLVLAARQVLIQSWCTEYQLPITFITGSVKARCYLDDRMVPVLNGDWPAVAKGVEDQLAQRSELDTTGIRRLIQLPEQGELIEDWPDPDAVPQDQPRGLSTRILDVDVHRCLSDSNTSAREGRIAPGAVDALRQVWDAGFQIHLSCAGWDPADKSPEESAQRLAAMRQQMREAGVRYDQFVSKDHGTACVNDKGVTFTTWKAALPAVMRMLKSPAPDDEITGRGR